MRRVFLLLGLVLPVLAFAQPDQDWVINYDGGGNYVDSATQAITDAEGNLIYGGTSHDGSAGSDIIVFKLDRDDGSVIWEAQMSAYDHVSDMALDGLAWDGFGNIIVAGRLLGCGTG